MEQEQLNLSLNYPFRSYIQSSGTDRSLHLATFHPDANHPSFFFEASLANPKRFSELLRGITTVVKSRFHIPAAMLARILAESDPVVTCNDTCVRFESFSACCGVYGRADFLENSFRGEVLGRGTTNVDFNAPMLAALARLMASDQVTLAVGSDRVVLKKDIEEVTERKVKLPIRWMRGFVEVQAVQNRMTLMNEVSGLIAFRFLRSLPTISTNQRESYIVSSGSGLRISQVRQKGSIKIGGLQRLQVLKPMVKNAKKLQIYSDEKTGATAWVLHFEDCRFHLVISPEVWRGFSGEGQVLHDLVDDSEDYLPLVRAQLKWQSVLCEKDLLNDGRLKSDQIKSALVAMGTRGLVGYDLVQQAYFHRELPFDVSKVEQQQPRLRSARKLIEEERVSVCSENPMQVEFSIRTNDVTHRVKYLASENDDDPIFKCTCPWFNKHGTSRGPCKHILATQIFLENRE